MVLTWHIDISISHTALNFFFFWVFTHIIQSCSSSSFFLPSPVKLTTTVQRAADHTLFLIGQLNQSRTIGKPAELIGYPIYILATSLLYQFSIENERRRSSKKKKKRKMKERPEEGIVPSRLCSFFSLLSLFPHLFSESDGIGSTRLTLWAWTRSHLSYAKQSEQGGWMDEFSLSFLPSPTSILLLLLLYFVLVIGNRRHLIGTPDFYTLF